MPSLPTTAEWCCPSCGSGLEGASLACARCDCRYPLVDGIPWLLPRPALRLSAWRGRCRAMLARLRRQAGLYRSHVDVARGLSIAATRRLTLLAAACEDQAGRLEALLAPLLGPDGAAHPATYEALGEATSASENPLAYFANVHRDWSWGERENRASLEAVAAAMGSHRAGRTLVLGAGAGRLAFDVHESLGPELTVAADINPLLLLVAHRMYSGAELALHEFPLAPRDLASHAVLRTLRAPSRARPGLLPVFADALEPPFAPGSFDTVLTPWLVDVVDADFARLAAAVNRLLRPGGQWICTGTLFFQSSDPSQAYSTEEVAEIVEGARFERPAFAEHCVPYLVSPASRHARNEHVVTFGVTKLDDALPARAAGVSWLENPAVPMPLPPAVAQRALALRVEGYVASLVDGRCSAAQIAERLVRERLLLPDEALGVVQDYLRRLFDTNRN